MREKQMATIWGKYIKDNPPARLETYELKFTKKKIIRFDAVADHQVFYLEKSNLGFYYKIPDMAAKDGYSNKKPFDSFWMIDSVPFIVVWFYEPRKPKVFYKIPLLDFLTLRENSTRKSFREVDLIGISEQIHIT